MVKKATKRKADKYTKKTRILLLFVLFIIGFSFMGFNGWAATPYDSLEDNFKVTATPIATSKADLYRAEVGDVSIESFENLGIYGYTENSIIYWGDLVLGTELNGFSIGNVRQYDLDRKVYYNSYSRRWLSMWAYEEKTSPSTHSEFLCDVDYSSFNFQFSPTRMTGIQLNIEYNAIDDRLLYFDSKEINATIPKTEVVFDKSIAGDYTMGDVAVYNDVFENAPIDIKLSATDYTKDSAGSGGDANSEVVGQIATAGIGVTFGSIYSTTLQAKTLYTSSKGSVIHHDNEKNSVSMVIPMTIQPNIYNYKQKIQVTHATLWVDTDDSFFSPSGITYFSPSATQTYYRVNGVHVNNYYIHKQVSHSAKVFSTLELSVPVSEKVLANPEIIAGDFIWDIGVEGFTGVNIGLTESEDPLSWFNRIFGAILGQIIGVFAVILIVYAIITNLPAVFKMTSKAGKSIGKIANK